MQLQLNVNDFKANIFLELLDVFKKDDLIKDYKIINSYNEDENQILDDLKELKVPSKNSGDKTEKCIHIHND
ncbi:hypothetical protein JHD49_10685 [Sulfurimonas sp. SAG-AH-194-C21]|nr:hypothetical protein [Sulfurimonas sp. SAG-AH-194-C21]MDF1884408.1 hypothetical protein [Sulfurimonas sp. SAG-AH-194-C21]